MIWWFGSPCKHASCCSPGCSGGSAALFPNSVISIQFLLQLLGLVRLQVSRFTLSTADVCVRACVCQKWCLCHVRTLPVISAGVAKPHHHLQVLVLAGWSTRWP